MQVLDPLERKGSIAIAVVVVPLRRGSEGVARWPQRYTVIAKASRVRSPRKKEPRLAALVETDVKKVRVQVHVYVYVCQCVSQCRSICVS